MERTYCSLMDGLELKVLRVRADIRGQELATAMGCTASNISRIEARRSVSREVADRYIAALAKLTSKSDEVA